MKNKFFILLLLVFVINTKAQIAKWLIAPIYEDLDVNIEEKMIVADSANSKILFTLNGERILTTHYQLYPFRDERAVAVKPNTQEIVCIYKPNGDSRQLENTEVTYDYPFYSNGKLLVKQNGFYRFVNVNGDVLGMKYTQAYPFFNGYANCKTFENIDKMKTPLNMLIDSHENLVNFIYNGKQVSNSDVEFISSVNDENIAFIVFNHKLFEFNGKDQSIKPVFATLGDYELKNQAKIDDDINVCLRTGDDNTITLLTKSGKTGYVVVTFDMMMKPISIKRNETNQVYKIKEINKSSLESSFKSINANNLYGISLEDKEILPPQFDLPAKCFGDNALVKLNGMYGMLHIYKDKFFSIQLNKNKEIAFLHRQYETTARVNIPTVISAEKVFFQVNPKSGCSIDNTSREWKNTESGNFIEYNCLLDIPSGLTDEIKKINYKGSVTYNGLKSPEIDFSANSWFYKNFEVEEDVNQRVLENGNLTFVFFYKNIQNDGRIARVDVDVIADTLDVRRDEKITETRYKYTVMNLAEGSNNIVIEVKEQGCPPICFQFDVEYTKPVEKTRSTKASEAKVVIRKKSQKQYNLIL